MSEQRPHFPKRVRPAVVGLLGRLNYTAFLRHGTFQDATTGVPFPDDAQEIVRLRILPPMGVGHVRAAIHPGHGAARPDRQPARLVAIVGHDDLGGGLGGG